VAVIASLVYSDATFLFWKRLAIPTKALPQMIADLERAGKISADNEGRSIRRAADVPRSLWALGSPADYSVLEGEWLTRPDYKGLLAAHIVFGGKPRSWGLVVEPPGMIDNLTSGSGFRYIRVATNASLCFRLGD
jgi:hypothetical protein